MAPRQHPTRSPAPQAPEGLNAGAAIPGLDAAMAFVASAVAGDPRLDGQILADAARLAATCAGASASSVCGT